MMMNDGCDAIVIGVCVASSIVATILGDAGYSLSVHRKPLDISWSYEHQNEWGHFADGTRDSQLILDGEWVVEVKT